MPGERERRGAKNGKMGQESSGTSLSFFVLLGSNRGSSEKSKKLCFSAPSKLYQLDLTVVII